jgi:hypothetical protein
VADNLSKAGWSCDCVSAIDSHGRTIWIADAHRDDGKRFVVRADDKLTAFIELESAICATGPIGCSAWLDGRSLVNIKVVPGNDVAIVCFTHLFQELLFAACLSTLISPGLIAAWVRTVVKNQQAGFGFRSNLSKLF